MNKLWTVREVINAPFAFPPSEPGNTEECLLVVVVMVRGGDGGVGGVEALIGGACHCLVGGTLSCRHLSRRQAQSLLVTIFDILSQSPLFLCFSPLSLIHLSPPFLFL